MDWANACLGALIVGINLFMLSQIMSINATIGTLPCVLARRRGNNKKEKCELCRIPE